MLARLHHALAAVCPIVGVSGEQGGIRIDYAPGATQAQRTAAQNAMAAFDWSEAAHAAWLATQARASAKAWVLGPSMEARAVKALALLVLEQINIVRQNPTTTHAAHTQQQLLDAFLAKIDVS